MTIDKQLVRKNFSRHAHEYDLYAKIQTLMAHKLMEMISQQTINTFHSVLEIGCGTGNLTKLLLEQFPKSNYTIIDLTESMIQQTKHKLKGMQSTIQFFT